MEKNTFLGYTKLNEYATSYIHGLMTKEQIAKEVSPTDYQTILKKIREFGF
jgi:hypothetical protein